MWSTPDAIHLQWDRWEGSEFEAYELYYQKAVIVPVSTEAAITITLLGVGVLLVVAIRRRKKRDLVVMGLWLVIGTAVVAQSSVLDNVLVTRITDRSVTSFTDSFVREGSSYTYVLVVDTTKDGRSAASSSNTRSRPLPTRAEEPIELWNLRVEWSDHYDSWGEDVCSGNAEQVVRNLKAHVDASAEISLPMYECDPGQGTRCMLHLHRLGRDYWEWADNLQYADFHFTSQPGEMRTVLAWAKTRDCDEMGCEDGQKGIPFFGDGNALSDMGIPVDITDVTGPPLHGHWDGGA